MENNIIPIIDKNQSNFTLDTCNIEGMFYVNISISNNYFLKRDQIQNILNCSITFHVIGITIIWLTYIT